MQNRHRKPSTTRAFATRAAFSVGAAAAAVVVSAGGASAATPADAPRSRAPVARSTGSPPVVPPASTATA